MKRLRIFFAVVVACVGAAGAVAVASQGGDSSEIHACAQKVTGQARILLNAQGSCRPSEVAVTWSAGGPSVQQLDRVTVADKESRVLTTEGPVALTARCEIQVEPFPGAGFKVDRAVVDVSTTQDHTAVAPQGGLPGEIQAGESRRVLTATFPFPGLPQDFPVFQTGSFYVLTPDGTTIGGQLAGGIHLLGQPGSCVFSGFLVTNG